MTTGRDDGRAARRLRSGDAVIDALLALTTEQGKVPSPADIASRAGVSLRSVYLYMADAEFMSRLIARSAAKDVEAFELADLGEGSLDHRIHRLVSTRVAAIGAARQLIRASVALFDTYPAVRDNYDHQRHLLRLQTESQFATELDRLAEPDRRNLFDAIDGFIQLEAIRYQLETLGRSVDEVIMVLIAGLERLLGATPPR